MNLYFRCPDIDQLCVSRDYRLESGHIVTAGENGVKKLKGTVTLPACPLCGKKHTYDVEDVMCSLDETGKEDNDGNND